MNVKITEIKSNPNNPRIIKDDKYKKLLKSLKEFPEMLEKRPLVCFTDVDKKYVVLGGNMRLKAANELGFRELPIILADDWTEEKRKEFLIKDNVGFGEWNWEELQQDWDMELIGEWGVDVPDFAITQLEAEEDEFNVPEGGIETDIVLGDLFEIGEHRLLCGDSTDSDAVGKLMNGEISELLFTSPPYSDMRDYNGDKDVSISNIIEFIPTFLPYANYQVINLGLQRKDGEVYAYWDEYIQIAKECGYKFISWNIWDRMAATSIANQSAMFAIYHEWIFVFGKEVKSLNRTWDKSEESKKREKSYNVNNKGQKVVARRQKDGGLIETGLGKIYENKNMGTVYSGFAEMERSIQHPAKFPVHLPCEYIKAMTNEKDVVVESFTGSGTTMVAAHQLNRKCYGMELDPKYCQVIIDRMIKLDSTLIIKKNGELYNNVKNE